MIKPITLLVIAICFSAFSTRIFAQDRIADSIQLHQTASNMAVAFNKAIGEQTRLYNGPAFIDYNLRLRNNANFNDTTAFEKNTLNYDNVIYTGVPLMYDLYQGLVVSLGYNGFAKYSLVSEKVVYFNLYQHHFIRFDPDSLNKVMVAGFYDELYSSKLRLLARRTKSQQNSIVSEHVIYYFVPSTDYFLFKNGKYYNVNSEGNFYDVLKDRKAELKKYAKDNKIKFGKTREHAMAVLVAYYDHITN